jgi:hypothetical protein
VGRVFFRETPFEELDAIITAGTGGNREKERERNPPAGKWVLADRTGQRRTY